MWSSPISNKGIFENTISELPIIPKISPAISNYLRPSLFDNIPPTKHVRIALKIEIFYMYSELG